MTEIVLAPTAPTSPMASTAPPAPSLADGARKKTHYKTIVVSDTHMGDPAALAAFLLEFFRHNSCDRLILNGDIIDGWEMIRKKSRPFTEMEARVWDAINHLSSQGAEVIYIRGNHDHEIIDKKYGLKQKIPHIFEDQRSGNSAAILFRSKYTFLDNNNEILRVLHGDVFDKNLKKLLKHPLGKIIDEALEGVDGAAGELRAKLTGKSARLALGIYDQIKKKVLERHGSGKGISQGAVNSWLKTGTMIVIMGHSHQPCDISFEFADTSDGEVHKLRIINEGDWVISRTAAVERNDGVWAVLNFAQQLESLGVQQIAHADAPNECIHMRGVTFEELEKFRDVWPGKDVDRLSGKFAKHAHYYSILVSAFKDVSKGHNKNNESYYIASKIEETGDKLYKIAKKLFPVDISFKPEFEQSVRSELNKKFQAVHFDPGQVDRSEISLEQYLKMMKEVYLMQYDKHFPVPQAA